MRTTTTTRTESLNRYEMRNLDGETVMTFATLTTALRSGMNAEKVHASVTIIDTMDESTVWMSV